MLYINYSINEFLSAVSYQASIHFLNHLSNQGHSGAEIYPS